MTPQDQLAADLERALEGTRADGQGWSETEKAGIVHWLPALLAERRELVAEVARLREAIQHGRWRADDLRWCNKDDACHTKAEGADLVLADIDDALSRAALTPGEPAAEVAK